jgi:hypothetical protein
MVRAVGRRAGSTPAEPVGSERLDGVKRIRMNGYLREAAPGDFA